MKPKLNKNFSLPWTPHGEKASENHQILLPRGKASSFLKFPPCKLISACKLTWSHWLSCINSLTSPAVLLWPIHHHSHKYLYHLSSMCEQKLIVKKQHIYETKPHETIMADLNLWCAQQTLSQALHFSGKNVCLSSLPSSKTFRDDWTLWTNTKLSRGGMRKLLNSSLMNNLIRIERVSEGVIDHHSTAQ